MCAIEMNPGMITLHAAHLVTETGEVDCFEPNPDCLKIIDSNLYKIDPRIKE